MVSGRNWESSKGYQASLFQRSILVRKWSAGAGLLAMDAPRFSRPYASSLTAIASKPAPTWDVWRTLIFKGRLFLQG
jgi:hypothetical protein